MEGPGRQLGGWKEEGKEGRWEVHRESEGELETVRRRFLRCE